MGMMVSSKVVLAPKACITSSLTEEVAWGSFPRADAGSEDVGLPPAAAPRDNEPQRMCTVGVSPPASHR